MIVCSCNVLSDTKIRASLNGEASPKTPGAVYRCLGCSPNCGRCFATVRNIITQALSETNGANADIYDVSGDSGLASFAS
jgi:bacterioferritin-associated ferredoxin